MAVLEHDWYPEALPPNVQIGPRSWLYSSYAFLHYQSRRPIGVRIGPDTGIYNGSFFELGPSGEVEIGEFCTLVGAIICTNLRVVVEDYVFIAHEVTIADEPVARPLNFDQWFESSGCNSGVFVGRNAWIGARATLLAPARIGEGAIVGAGTVVDFEVAPYAIVAGNPARVVGWAKPDERMRGHEAPRKRSRK